MKVVEAFIQVERSDCVVTNLVFSRIPEANVSRLLVGEETSLHKVRTENVSDVVTEFRRIASSVRQVSKDTLWVESGSCSACSFFSRSKIPILSTRTFGENKLGFRILAPTRKSLDHLMEELAAAGLRPHLLEVNEGESYNITEREKEVLLFAFNHGYFESERDTNLTKLAERLNVSPSSLSDVLRRAMKKVVIDYLKRM